ncbi:carbohydrate ABC transporter permease [Planococcus sp. CP5-4]|uniref:carbohydrate ABC transporter permease n=1 Tax=unclassified Planococcus (in: firmicutes) TaxID=2662419 RepID=UPI001C24D359|nr:MULTISPECIES: carbohydrate ABC transporter permease [unclassified Planococcus (in: firmicutes)]MBU9672694.1 carbohydrate ABC transporter permease [Planococcus sp. CP5-4_YE]MBV0908468.1 carbohydrate ABC transporter permease [Planococcus sp. CP5-4_UN]MBW6063235.1 carbohydrate ABC transporter permease [Planococcus sp. CP5-4]
MELKNKYERALIYTLMTIGGLLVSLPFVWMILSSFKDEREVLSIPPTLFPENPTIAHYFTLFENLNFDVYLVNTLIIVFFSMIGLLLNTMAGYGFGKFQFRGKETWFIVVLITMMIPGQVTMIPTYLILNEAGLTNTMTGIILPGLIAAFNIFLIRQFMVTIPDDLIEAARLDGANEFYIFVKLIIPLSKPILAVQIILTFIGSWNSFLWPLIIANDESLYTLSVGLALLQDQNVTNYGLQMAGSAFMVVPVLIIFIIFQKYIVEGFNVSGIK